MLADLPRVNQEIADVPQAVQALLAKRRRRRPVGTDAVGASTIDVKSVAAVLKRTVCESNSFSTQASAR
jgi:hypothetical protein